MTSQLPSNPSLEQLRKQAKDVLKAHKSGDASCCAVLKNLHQFKGKRDEGILKAEVGLQEVQFALAMEYGFSTWEEMKRRVSGEDEAMPTETKHEDGRVWIEGLPEVDLGERWDMLLRSLEYILKSRGETATLNDLMVYSGDAFSLTHADSWQYMAYLFIPTDALGNAAQLLGYDYNWLRSDIRGLEEDEIGKKTSAILETIWAEIDEGRPVMVAGCADQGCAKWSVVVGYDRENMQMCHNGIGGNCRWTGIRGLNIDLDGENYPQSWNGRLRGQIGGHIGGWLVNLGFVVGNKGKLPSEKEGAITVLRRAVELFNASTRRIGNENFYFGRQAYEQWAESLAELDYPADTKKPIPEGSWHLYEMENIDYMVDIIVRGRAAAAEYLERTADAFPQGQGYLLNAARSYREEVQMAQSAFDVFIPPWSGNTKAIDKWLGDKSILKTAAASVAQMLEKEKAAIGEIEKALGVIE